MPAAAAAVSYKLRQKQEEKKEEDATDITSKMLSESLLFFLKMPFTRISHFTITPAGN